MSLATARIMAQRRIDAAQPNVPILVWNEEGQLVDNRLWGAFIGNLHSRINYTLKPDVDGMDKSLISIEDLLDKSKELNVTDGCTGNWNAGFGTEEGAKSKDAKSRGSAKGKNIWWHTERYRWADIPLEKFF